MYDVSIIPCKDYDLDSVKAALETAVLETTGFDWLKPGMKVALKANYLAPKAPGLAATTHPAVINALAEILISRGAGEVIVGDSPGGPFGQIFLDVIYRATGANTITEHGGKANDNFGTATVSNPGGKVLKEFSCCSWLLEADAVINVCKLKTHGLTGMSCAAKNLYGVVPGPVKTEYHYLHPDMSNFAEMIVDIDEYMKPVLNICDAVIGMEGNGPNNGTPREIGVLMASASPHKLDLAAARLIGLTLSDVPTLGAARARGLIPDTAEELSIFGSLKESAVPDYGTVKVGNTYIYSSVAKGIKNQLISRTLETLFRPRPALTGDCIGCGKCAKSCPAGAISIKSKKAVISRSKCIRCFCCQEFCPAGALSIRRTLISKIVNR